MMNTMINQKEEIKEINCTQENRGRGKVKGEGKKI